MTGAEAIGADPVQVHRCQRNQVFEIELGRHLEQDAAAMTLASGCCLHRPGSIARGELQFSGMDCFVQHPVCNLEGKCKFGEWGADVARQLFLECRTIYRRSFFRFYFCHRPALHEQALATVKRCQFMMTRDQRLHLRCYTEQARQKIFEVRRHCDQQFGFRLAGEGTGGQPGGFQLRAQFRVASSQIFAESRIDADQSFPVVKIVECESVGKARMLAMQRVILGSLHKLQIF